MKSLGKLALMLAMCLLPSFNVLSETISNGSLAVSFDDTDGRLVSIRDVVSGFEFIDPSVVDAPFWRIRRADGTVVGGLATLSGIEKVSGLEAIIRWTLESGIRVRADVRLDSVKPLSYWNVSLEGIADAEVYDLQYPLIKGIKRFESEDLAVSTWLGSVIHDPHSPVSEANPRQWYGWDSPGILSMQMIALYDRDSGDGLYLASNDTLSYSKRYEFMMDQGHTEYALTNSLPYHSGDDAYSPCHEAIIGSLNGDWLTAASMYREWALGQKWCKESRFHAGKTPKWVTGTGLWVWNRGASDNVLKEALHLKKKLGLPVSVLWHWWHGCSYDEGFPEYLPPREGADHFREAVARARKKKVNSIVYMNSYQWGTSTDSWTAENASAYCARPLGGESYAYAANVFTGRKIAAMCLGTEFWRQKYSSIAETAICDLGVSGIYMDQACSSIRCFNPEHGHTLGGGNYWKEGFARQASMIREKVGDRRKNVVLAGEGSGEDWIPSLDLFLTLEASRERYLGTGSVETIPLYQAVYHDHAITFGSYSSLVYPPYDDLWPDEYRPANRETPLPEEFNMQFRMEQARSFVFGMQLTLANYHSFLDDCRKEEIDFLVGLAKVRMKSLKYLMEGTFERVPKMDIPRSVIDVSKLSIYAGRTGSTVAQEKMDVPLLYAGMWKAKDGTMGLSLVNIGDEALPVEFTINAEDYDLPSGFRATLVTEKGRKRICRAADGRMDISMPLAGRSACVIEFR